MKIIAAGKTDKGLVRPDNEDNFLIDENLKLFIVADGAGGHSSGEVASKLAVNITKQQIEKYFKGEDISFGPKTTSFSKMTNALCSSIKFANQIIYEASKKYPQNNGMATTCVAAIVGENSFSYCNVGDSRIYLLRDNELKLLTTDHSLVNEQLKLGLITEEQAEKSEYSNILTRALGMSDSVEVDVNEMKAKDKDVLILCTDGLSKMVKYDIIHKTLIEKLAHGNTLSDICDYFINLVNSFGGKDNVTIVIVQLFIENKFSLLLKKILNKKN